MKKVSKKAPKFRNIKIVVMKHSDGYVAYPLGVTGSCVGQGDTFEEAYTCVSSMLKELIEIYGDEILEDLIESPVQEAFIAETRVCA